MPCFSPLQVSGLCSTRREGASSPAKPHFISLLYTTVQEKEYFEMPLLRSSHRVPTAPGSGDSCHEVFGNRQVNLQKIHSSVRRLSIEIFTFGLVQIPSFPENLLLLCSLSLQMDQGGGQWL